MDGGEFERILGAVRGAAEASGAFQSVRLADGRLECGAKDAAEPAFYRVELDDGRIWVSLVTENRWLSESIEATLMHSGDKIEELLDEELVDQGFEGGSLPVQHYRSDDMLFTFRSAVPDPSPESVARVLLAYEACFGQLGDMDPGEED